MSCQCNYCGNKTQPVFWGIILIFFIAVLCAVILNPIHKQNIEKLGKNLYKFQDTLEFRDKDTDKMIKRLDNVEFRLLNKDDIVYGVKIKAGEKEQEVLVMDKIPSDCFLVIKKEPK